MNTIANIIDKLPEEDRRKLLEKEYNILPRRGLSASEWIRARRQTLYTVAFLSILICVTIISVISIITILSPQKAATLRSYEYKEKWETLHHSSYEEIDTHILKDNLEKIRENAQKGPEYAMQFITEQVDSNPEYRTKVPVYIDFLESWLECLDAKNCADIEEVNNILGRPSSELWANYRCWINGLREKGYAPDYGRRLQERYEKQGYVLSGRLAAAREYNRAPAVSSLDICYKLPSKTQ